MTFNKQCEATYTEKEAGHIVHCVKDDGHPGKHIDARGNWDNEKVEKDPQEDP